MTRQRAAKGEFLSRVPQSALDEISLQMQEQRETIERLKTERRTLVDALTLALPYVESALEDQGYKPRVVDRMVKTIRDALSLAEGNPLPEECCCTHQPETTGRCVACGRAITDRTPRLGKEGEGA